MTDLLKPATFCASMLPLVTTVIVYVPTGTATPPTVMVRAEPPAVAACDSVTEELVAGETAAVTAVIVVPSWMPGPVIVRPLSAAVKRPSAGDVSVVEMLVVAASVTVRTGAIVSWVATVVALTAGGSRLGEDRVLGVGDAHDGRTERDSRCCRTPSCRCRPG